MKQLLRGSVLGLVVLAGCFSSSTNAVKKCPVWGCGTNGTKITGTTKPELSGPVRVVLPQR